MTSDPPSRTEDSFIYVLIGDVTSAMADVEAHNDSRVRRSCVRCIFASIEGLFATAIKSVECLPLTRAEFAVIKELSYEVRDNGSIVERPKFVPLDRKLKAVVRITRRVRPTFSIDLDHPGWPALLAALDLRHRLTHPKVMADLEVSEVDVREAFRGYSWFLAFVLLVMSETNQFLEEANRSLPAEVRKMLGARSKETKEA